METTGGGEKIRESFIAHVFSTTEPAKAEILNTLQYAVLATIPVVALNKFIQRFIPEADDTKSSIELAVEVLIQLIVLFVGLILIHRVVTFVPTYSGFRYDSMVATNVVVAFLIIVLSIQTKLGLKINILFDRVEHLWNGEDPRPYREGYQNKTPNAGGGGGGGGRHVASQGDHLDHPEVQRDVFPPAPTATSKAGRKDTYDTMMRGEMGPMPANSFLGSSFGAV